jgi:ABC-2 type transport system permease protein
VTGYFFGGTFLYWLFLIVIVAVITMRLLAEERRSGTLETLLTAPVSEAEIVFGKYIGALVFYGFLWVPTLLLVGLAKWLAPEGAMSWGAVGAGYLGTGLVGASSIAIGLLASALTRSQLVAALVTFTALSLFVLIGVLEPLVHTEVARSVIAYLDLFGHMEAFSRGIVDSRHVVAHASIAGFCLVAAAQALEVGRWR